MKARDFALGARGVLFFFFEKGDILFKKIKHVKICLFEDLYFRKIL